MSEQPTELHIEGRPPERPPEPPPERPPAPAPERPAPNPYFICGRAPDGQPCNDGPSASGHCPCDPACDPIPAPRLRRRRAAIWTILAAVGLTLILVAGPWGDDAIVPGPLGAAHANLINDCAACHEPADGALAATLRFATSADGLADSIGRATSDRCTACHDRGRQPLKPHNHAIPELQRLAPKNADPGGSIRTELAAALVDPHADIQCVACHREHHGRNADITELNDAQCQTCHSVRFNDFLRGHPDFTDYPFNEPQRIAFNHDRHVTRHFNDERHAQHAPASCNDCHRPDPMARDMTTVGFKNGCADCHTEEIVGVGAAGDRGVAFFRIPAIDLDALEDADIDIGHWPADSRFDDGQLTPFQQALLRTEPGYENHRAALDAIDLRNLDDADESQRDAAAWVAWTTKRQVADLRDQGHNALVQRISQNLGRPAPINMAGRLIAGLPRHTIHAIADDWFPGLDDELAAHDAGEPIPDADAEPTPAPTTDADADPLGDDLLGDDLLAGDDDPWADAPETDAPDALRPDDWAAAGGWYVNDLTHTLHYRPVAHADPFLKTWIDVSASASAMRPVRNLLFDENAVGACMKCHTDGPAGVHWKTRRPTHARPWTHFSHAPHIAGGPDACTDCHQLRSAPASRTARPDVASFVNMTVADCNACHTPQAAGASCLQCHTYHVGEFEALRIPADIPTPQAGEAIR